MNQVEQPKERARPNFGVKSLQQIKAAKAAAAAAKPSPIAKAGSISQSVDPASDNSGEQNQDANAGSTSRAAKTSSEGSGEQEVNAEGANAEGHKSDDFKGKLKVMRGGQSLDVSFEKHVPQARLQELRRRKAKQAAS